MASQQSRNSSMSTSMTSAEAITKYAYKRSQFVITNTSVAAVVTISKGDVAVVAGAGIVLQPKQSYLESTDSGFECWQGAVQAVSDVAGTIAIVETFREA